MVRDRLHAFVDDSEVLPPTAHGPLDDLDVAVKDLFAVEGRVASFGHPAWRRTHAPATTTSPTVVRLRAAGARIVGFTKMDQLAFSLVGDVGEGEPPRNPRHPALFCGGSSSGAASAVAGSRALLGIGTDTAGSVRVPAALCGIHGLRPTWGRLDPRGVTPLAPSFDTVGLLAGNARVLRQALRVLDATPRTTPVLPTRVLVAPDVLARVDERSGAALRRAAAELAARTGASLVEVDLSALVNDDVAHLLSRLQGREAWAQHGRWVTAHADHLDAEVVARLRRCREWARESPEEIGVDERDRRAYRLLLGELLGDDSVLVLPSLGTPAPRRSDDPGARRRFRGSTLVLTAPASLAGLPQLTWTMPSTGGSPGTGVHAAGILAPHGADDLLIDLLEALGTGG